MLIQSRSALLFLPSLALAMLPTISAADAPQKSVSATYGNVPLQFEENRAQADEAVRFTAHGPGYTLFLTPQETVLVLDKPGDPNGAAALRMSVVGARATAAVRGVDELPGKANYFIGNDPSHWRTNIPTFAKVRYSGVYPGIDLVYYGQQRQLEYDFVVAPGADPNQITLGFTGANDLEIDAQGELVLHTAAGDVRQHRPVVYQEADGIRHEIEGRYVRRDEARVGFEVAEYDRGLPLVIDPVLSYSTYLGGSDSDYVVGIAIDPDGNAYVTGLSQSSNFPTTPGTLHPPAGFNPNYVFVTKLNSVGSVVYSAYFAGTSEEASFPSGIVIDSARNVYVTGSTSSMTFPTTPGALRRTPPPDRVPIRDRVGFVTKLDATGSTLVYSTYLGGSGGSSSDSSLDSASAIAVDAGGNAYVTGSTSSPDFPTTIGAFQTSHLGASFVTNAFVAKLDPSGGALVYSTYLGGSTNADGVGIAVDAAGEAYVAGTTTAPDFPTTAGAFQTVLRGGRSRSFVTKLNAEGSALVYSTYLGGSGTGPDSATAISIDASGHAYVTGSATSSDFPVTPGAFQVDYTGRPAFVTKLDASGSSLVYSTFLSGDGLGAAIAVDGDGDAFVTVSAGSDFAVALEGCQSYGGNVDAFVTMLNPSGSAIVYSTYLGGSQSDTANAIAIDTGGTAYVAGTTTSTLRDCPCTNDFPTTPGAFQPQYGGGRTDGFIAKIAEPVLPLPAPTPNSASPPAMASAATGQADSGSGQTTASTTNDHSGGGAFDWFTLSALLAALSVSRRRRAQR